MYRVPHSALSYRCPQSLEAWWYMCPAALSRYTSQMPGLGSAVTAPLDRAAALDAHPTFFHDTEGAARVRSTYCCRAWCACAAGAGSNPLLLKSRGIFVLTEKPEVKQSLRPAWGCCSLSTGQRWVGACGLTGRMWCNFSSHVLLLCCCCP